MTQKAVLVTGWHAGSSSALAPVVRELRRRGTPVRLAAFEVGVSGFLKAGAKPDVIMEKATPEAVTRLLESEKPRAVLTGTSFPDEQHPFSLEQETVLSAGLLGVRSIAVLDFWSRYLERFSGLDTSAKPAKVIAPFRYLPDVICVPDGIAEDSMASLGFDRSRLRITGNPYFSYIAERFRDITVIPRMPSVLLCSQPISMRYGDSYGFTEKTNLEALHRVLSGLSREFGTLQLVIRKHPSEGPIDIARLASSGLQVCADSNSSIHMSMSDARVVVGAFTTALVEARVMGKPAISVQIGRDAHSPDPLVTNGFGITSLALTEPELGRLVRLAINGALEQKEMNVPADSTDRVIRQLGA